MKPIIENYRVIELDGWHAVQHKYDLITGNNWHTNGARYKNKDSAVKWLHELHNMDLKEYERLKNLGRSFPDND